MKPLLFLLILFFTHSLAVIAQRVTSPDKSDVVRAVPDSVVGKMQKDKDFRYANDMSYWKKAPPRRRSSFERLMAAITKSTAIKVVLYAMLIAGILYALYQVMVVNNFFIFSAGGKKRKTADGSDEAAANEDLDEKINEAVINRNYRLAIRYMYLKTLQLLSEKKIITLHAKSTNQDYIGQMYKQDNLAQFRHLTRIYEYVWYGKFDPSESQFGIISTNFNRFNHAD